MAKHGRPSTYSEDIAQEICERLSKGEPLAVICRDEGMPCPNTVRSWAKEREPLAEAIARAREDGFDEIAARVRETARGLGESTDDVQRDKLIIETDLKLLAKWDPKRYGDRLDLGNADGSPFQINVHRFGRSGENG